MPAQEDERFPSFRGSHWKIWGVYSKLDLNFIQRQIRNWAAIFVHQPLKESCNASNSSTHEHQQVERHQARYNSSTLLPGITDSPLHKIKQSHSSFLLTKNVKLKSSFKLCPFATVLSYTHESSLSTTPLCTTKNRLKIFCCFVHPNKTWSCFPSHSKCTSLGFQS